MTSGPRSAFVKAQAKINLFLHVGERKSDGYHALETLFLRTELADDVSVRVGGSRRTLECAGPAMPEEGLGSVEKNLAFRAALAYAERASWPDGFDVTITKTIPVGGGLGGGSADAGAVLRGLNALNGRPLDEETLLEVAAELGADVPFLTSTRVAAFASGRGDVLRSDARFDLPPRELFLVIPSFSIGTAEAYGWLDADRQASGRNPLRSAPRTPNAGGSWNWAAIEAVSRQGFANDFEPVVEARHPELKAYREWLTSLGAGIARLSGSGSTVFGVFDRALRFDTPGPETRILATRTAERVVQVEVRE
jgi:4-diphosphocytidyl-2-C-methyl-D-erythritol kinase